MLFSFYLTGVKCFFSYISLGLNLYTMNHYFLLTIDVEDWFQVENFKKYIPFSSWSSYELRVEKNTHRILDLLDSASFKFQVSSLKISATFFVLGWLAERLPHLVREIHSRGHEVASHGYCHNLCNEQSHEDLKADLCDSKSLLEDIIGNQVYGYRAPSFAINNDILKIIEDCGYLYDSSYNSFSMHGRYGQVSLSRNGTTGIAFRIPNARNTKHLPRLSRSSGRWYQDEIFTPPAQWNELEVNIPSGLNSKTVQLGHDSDSAAYFTGACPVKFTIVTAQRISLGPAP
jgi:polysaccharide deacetylase family protein (PEP-CTERM system associated)